MFSDVIIMWVNKENGRMFITANSSDNKTDENWIKNVQINFEKGAVNNNPKIVEDFLEDFHNDEFECLALGFNTRGIGFEYANQLVSHFKILQINGLNFTYNKNIKNEWSRSDNPSKLYKNFNFNSLPSIISDINTLITPNISRTDLAQSISDIIEEHIIKDDIRLISRDTISISDNSYLTDCKKIDPKKIKIVKICKECHIELLSNGACQGSSNCQYYDEIAPFDIREIKL